MSVNIDFDQNWSCCCRYVISDTENASTLSVSKVTEDFDWSPVVLPHRVPIEIDSKINNLLERWWYRKYFEWILSEEQLTSSVRLTFQSSDNNLENTSIVVWLDEAQLFSGSFHAPQTIIELPKKILCSDLSHNCNCKHRLIICCSHTSLSCHASLILPRDVLANVEEVPFNTVNDNATQITQENNNSRDYTASIDVIGAGDRPIFNALHSCSSSIQGSNELTLITAKKMGAGQQTLSICHKEEVDPSTVPLLSIVMLIVGTRGDVQPFIAYGKTLRAFGHRVRLATHEKFRSFVRENGLEFYPLARDPAEIMAYMVENSGIFPSLSSIITGNIFKRRQLFADILESTWLACTRDDDETGAPFRAEAIIANPISYGHVHCAQKLNVPLHMVFTMPYSPTSTFPHPLSTLDYTKPPRATLNKYSYSMVEAIMWLGIGDLINTFRSEILNLPPLHMPQATSMMIDEKIPYTYCWSPALVPKPKDWPYYIDVSGFFFLDLGSSYKSPPEDLLAFLGLSSDSKSSKTELAPPIFIGFGSITGHDSDRLLTIILRALQQTGYRALLSGFEVDSHSLPKNVFKIDEIPYDWLFQHVSAVCHHGGAGTTSTGLRAGKPTIIIPFFGDQFFWGSVVHKSGAGPPPLSGKHVTLQELVEAFKFVHRPDVQEAAQRVKEAMANENGCEAALRSFHANLPLSKMRSDLEPTFAACFRLDEFNMQISRPVAQVLLSAGLIKESQLRHHVTRDWQAVADDVSDSDVCTHPDSIELQLTTRTSRLSSLYGFSRNLNAVVGNKSRSGRDLRRTSSDSMQRFMIKEKIGTSTISHIVAPSLDLASSRPPMDISSIDNSNDHTELAQKAASVTGFSVETCQCILLEFDKFKQQRDLKQNIWPLKSRHSRFLQRQRSQSATFR